MLEKHLDVCVPLGEQVRIGYLRDEAPQYFARPVTEWLSNHFPNQWVGRNCPVVWPLRPTDLSPCDSYLWD